VLKRLALGLFLGLLIGAALASGLHFGLGVRSASGLLGYLLAMGAGATAGVLAGKPPWQQEAWIEAILKAVAGLGFGALVFWLTSSYVPWTLPSATLGLPESTRLAHSVLVSMPLTAGLFGMLVSLDNTSDAPSSKAKRARVQELPEVDAIPEPALRKSGKKARAQRRD
jgi:hypothetical protein